MLFLSNHKQPVDRGQDLVPRRVRLNSPAVVRGYRRAALIASSHNDRSSAGAASRPVIRKCTSHSVSRCHAGLLRERTRR